jgi:hypothetical protein
MISKFIFKLSIILASSFSVDKVFSQSICFYLTDDQTYVNASDGGNITFYKNGKVAINGKVNPSFSYKHIDCGINLYHKGKLINTLAHSAGYFDFKGDQLPDKYNCDCLIDNRKIVYTHLQKHSK